MRKLCAALTLWVFLVVPMAGHAQSLPPLDDPAFEQTCIDMYAARDADIEWPSTPAGGAHHCTLSVDGSDPADMTADDYRWALRKSLTFACKGRREVMYDMLRRLQSCDGEARSLTMQPTDRSESACRVRIEQTSEEFDVAPPLIEDLIDWRDNMPWYEAVLVDLFAPRELPMVMDGLIACSDGG